MATVIQLLTFVWNCFRATVTFLISVPGIIVNTLMGIGTAIYALIYNVYACLDSVITLFETSKELVQSFVESIASSYTWSFFYKLFALDTFGSVFSSFVSLVVLVIVLTVFEFFFTALCTAVPFLIYKSIGKIIQGISAGFVKPA